MRLWRDHAEAVTTAICAVAVGVGWMLLRGGLHAAGVVVLIAGYVIGGYRQARDGVVTLIRDRELDVDLLMVVAAIGAAAIGEWFDGALLIFIFALSGTLEGYASARTTRDIAALMALAPDEAIRLRDGLEQTVPASTLALRDRILVRPGARVPADGTVDEGSSSVNQAPITGESAPVDKVAGAEVFAGSINGHGALYVTVTRAPGETLLARIIELVKEAQANRPAAQLFIERFERGYAKVVVAGVAASGTCSTVARSGSEAVATEVAADAVTIVEKAVAELDSGRIAATTVRMWIHSGQLRAIRPGVGRGPGRTFRVARADLEQFLESVQERVTDSDAEARKEAAKILAIVASKRKTLGG